MSRDDGALVAAPFSYPHSRATSPMVPRINYLRLARLAEREGGGRSSRAGALAVRSASIPAFFFHSQWREPWHSPIPRGIPPGPGTIPWSQPHVHDLPSRRGKKMPDDESSPPARQIRPDTSTRRAPVGLCTSRVSSGPDARKALSRARVPCGRLVVCTCRAGKW